MPMPDHFRHQEETHVEYEITITKKTHAEKSSNETSSVWVTEETLERKRAL